MSGKQGATNNDEGDHTNMVQLMAQMREQNELIQAQITDQSAALTAALIALGRGPTTPTTDQRQTTADRLGLSVANATANGGIAGYDNERALTPEEEGLLTVYTSMGASIESAHEIFRVGPNSIQMLADLDNKAIEELIRGINTMKSPACPDKTAVYLGPRFSINLDTFVKWIKFNQLLV